MNIVMAQRELFNGIVSSKSFGRPAVLESEEARIFCPDGFRGYCIRESDFALDIDKFRKVKATIPLLKTDRDIQLKWTRAAIVDEPSRILRMYEGQGFSVYINSTLLRCFDTPELYAYSPADRVSVYEKGVFVGIVLPVKIRSDTDIGLFEKIMDDLKSA